MNTPSPIPNDVMKDHFLTWQCRIRQIAMRSDNGRPSSGMRPKVLTADGREIIAGMTTLIFPLQPYDSTAFFKHQLRKTNDPKAARERGLAFLQAEYYQRPKTFSDKLTALFPDPSRVTDYLVENGRCILVFEQYSQRYTMEADVTELPSNNLFFQATIWHNRIFNPQLPPNIHILEFAPRWHSAQADPSPRS